MSYLEKFNNEQQELLMSLPYRAGLLVSESDDEGGDESAEAELLTLESLLVGFAEDFLKSEFVEELMKQTVAHKEKWEGWSTSLETVPEQCKEALAILNGELEANDIVSFRQTLMEIAKAVAMAYREYDDAEASIVTKVKLYGEYYWRTAEAKIKKVQAPNIDEIFNISHSERQVLNDLSAALMVDLSGNPISL